MIQFKSEGNAIVPFHSYIYVLYFLICNYTFVYKNNDWEFFAAF